MTELLSTFIASFSAESVSNVFINLIVVILVISSILAFLGKAPRFSSNTSNLLTSLGILGTFAGIVVGLMEFDPKNIDGSIESLLSGLKTAFLTSLVGMAASIIYKSIQGFIPAKKNDGENTEASPNDILAVMNKQLEMTNKQTEVSYEILKSLKGDEDSSITSQVKMLRTDLIDNHKDLTQYLKNTSELNEKFQDKLWQKMDEFGELLSKSATEQVINALKEVIVDFNDKLTEQFGENFKRLDESVKKLVDWQENYRHQLEDMAAKYQLGVEAISSTEQSVAHINERAEAIPVTMEKLHQVMELGHGQVTELEERLEAFKDLRNKAIEAMPQIREQMDTTMNVIGDSVKAASTHYELMLNESQTIIDNFSSTASQSVDLMRTNLESGAENISNQLIESSHTLGGKLAEASSDIQEQVGTATGGLSNVTSHLTDTTEQIRQHLEDSITDLNGQLRVLVADIKDDSKETGRVLKEANQDLLTSTKEIQQEITNAISKLHERLETTLEDVFQVQAQAVRRTFDSLEDQITDSIGKTGSAVEKQVEVLDLQMQQEINRTMSEMGEALATITQQFTRDYQKLVREMNNVVTTSKVAV
ncbi:putative membrane protein [Vibrio nigripulchritudo SO65]|uniref:apolipoprotein A1/A4/E domain-containing protein n=1 Tax=Vibrio nigripulchritudo TaxID=28173 RepID=UPI0003B1AACD|nr:apolipoprotein A1/A4/E domain-containing protein [Vibrio nigripulchritudo]CCN34617.1 putative membrane protein [Vibrio nigripulchritudo AM115]CCN40571.1 putative membrane protein [Vibrio nigripulchritudo FTn2]CCN66135.1 putative membrane protein [Vibrio nigripulchritudo POn4]CCN78625.1 putative membrane protein [Vibrio nigripulchritudo SO65]